MPAMPREYIVSYEVFVGDSKYRNGHSIQKELNGNKFNVLFWKEETIKYWRKALGRMDVDVVITNIFENK